MSTFHVYVGRNQVPVLPVIRKLEPHDVKDALIGGIEDFRAMPSHLVFLGLVYPLCGMIIAYVTSQQNLLHLLFPLASGFALIGPFAAVGLYEMSRRRELGLDTSWSHAFDVLRSPSIPSILALGLFLMALFVAWLSIAQLLFAWLYGDAQPTSYQGFLTDVLSTTRGWTLIVVGCFIGFCFAVVTFSISVIAFPLLLDRDAGAAVAVAASVRAVVQNPMVMALWGLTIVAALIVGSLPFFVGLVIVMPILGHATWHFYRKVVVREPAQEHPIASSPLGKAAHDRVAPHSFLFPWPKARS
ncbi:MAG TPA: DUF2189 domain-containing protein [Roseiarcus sp.]|nr:DUF2189 domain-containing protein [Roseiarcus sp.]